MQKGVCTTSLLRLFIFLQFWCSSICNLWFLWFVSFSLVCKPKFYTTNFLLNKCKKACAPLVCWGFVLFYVYVFSFSFRCFSICNLWFLWFLLFSLVCWVPPCAVRVYTFTWRKTKGNQRHPRNPILQIEKHQTHMEQHKTKQNTALANEWHNRFWH